MDNNNKVELKDKTLNLVRMTLLYIPLIALILLVANNLVCVISSGVICWNGISKDTLITTYSFACYFYIFYFITFIFTKKRFKRLISTYIVTILFPVIVIGSAYIREKDSSSPFRGILTLVAYWTVEAPGIYIDENLRDLLSRPFIKERSVKELSAPYFGKEIYVLGGEARSQQNSIVIPVSIAGQYLRAVRVMPLSTNASDQIASLFTVGPRSFSKRRDLEADYDRELLNKGILVDEESDVNERHPIILNAIKQLGNLKRTFRVKIKNSQIALLAIIRENNGRKDNLWLFERNNLEQPTNLTAFYGPLERIIDKVEFSSDLHSIYIIGHIKLPQSNYTYDPLFARITPNGNRDDRFEQQWKTFLETSGFSIVAVDAVSVLRNGCLIVAFSPYKTENHQVLRLAQTCGDNGFELIGRGEFQAPYKNVNFDVKAEKIYELNDGNLLVTLRGWAVIKFNLKNREIDSDFQRNLIHTLRLLPVKEEESSDTYDWGGIRFGMLTPHSWLLFHSYKETPRVIVTDLNGDKLFESNNF